MQVFILSSDPVESAIMACNSHVVKICTEVGQILNSALHRVGVSTRWKVTHKNHPMSLWVTNRSHADWAYKHGIALCEEYTYRYGKRHKTQDFLESLDLSPLLDQGWKGFYCGVPPEFKKNDVVQAYRDCYCGERISAFAKWTRRERPSWFKSYFDKAIA